MYAYIENMLTQVLMLSYNGSYLILIPFRVTGRTTWQLARLSITYDE